MKPVDRFIGIFLGVVLVLWGAAVFIKGPYYSTKELTIIDFGGHTRFWGAFIAIVGTLWIAVSLRRQTTKGKREEKPPNQAL